MKEESNDCLTCGHAEADHPGMYCKHPDCACSSFYSQRDADKEHRTYRMNQLHPMISKSKSHEPVKLLPINDDRDDNVIEMVPGPREGEYVPAKRTNRKDNPT